MASKQTVPRRDGLAGGSVKSSLDFSNFDINAVLRGAQLTLVGAHRALQNPEIFTSRHYRQAVYAVAAGIAIRLAIAVPILGIKAFIYLISLMFRLDQATWDDKVVGGLNFIEEYVLQVPFFLMTLVRYISPSLDNMFMDSLRWVDLTYVKKHENDDPRSLRDLYYPNLDKYPVADGSSHVKTTGEAITMFLVKYGRKAGVSLAVFALSFLPLVGRFVLPAASFYTFKEAVGMGPAAAIFGVGVILPRRYLVVFLQTYFASRSLMRELLEPYFSRVHFTKQQKRKWFRAREGLLFGFGIGFYVLIRVPLLGVLVYGIAEASTAYLVTKITDPPPPVHNKVAFEQFAERQQEWRNKHEIVGLSLSSLDGVSDEATGSARESGDGSDAGSG